MHEGLKVLLSIVFSYLSIKRISAFAYCSFPVTFSAKNCSCSKFKLP